MNRKSFKSLGSRIVQAYLVYALGCALFFAVMAVVVVEGIEVWMVDERLEEVAAWARRGTKASSR